MADAPNKPYYVWAWRKIYLGVLLNLAAWIAILAMFTHHFEPAP